MTGQFLCMMPCLFTLPCWQSRQKAEAYLQKVESKDVSIYILPSHPACVCQTTSFLLFISNLQKILKRA